jgi:hypothetical protein
VGSAGNAARTQMFLAFLCGSRVSTLVNSAIIANLLGTSLHGQFAARYCSHVLSARIFDCRVDPAPDGLLLAHQRYYCHRGREPVAFPLRHDHLPCDVTPGRYTLPPLSAECELSYSPQPWLFTPSSVSAGAPIVSTSSCQSAVNISSRVFWLSHSPLSPWRS